MDNINKFKAPTLNRLRTSYTILSLKKNINTYGGIWTGLNNQQFFLKSEANQIAKYMTFYFLSDKNMKEKYQIIKYLQWNNALSIIEDYLELFFCYML